MSDTEFAAAVEYAEREGYGSSTCWPLSYVEWQLNDRDRALLALLRKELTNHRMIRIAIPNRITK